MTATQTTFSVTTTAKTAGGFHATIHAYNLTREQAEREVFRLMTAGYKFAEIDVTPEGV